MSNDDREARNKIAKALMNSRNSIVVELDPYHRSDIQRQTTNQFIQEATKLTRTTRKKIKLVAVPVDE